MRRKHENEQNFEVIGLQTKKTKKGSQKMFKLGKMELQMDKKRLHFQIFILNVMQETRQTFNNRFSLHLAVIPDTFSNNHVATMALCYANMHSTIGTG